MNRNPFKEHANGLLFLSAALVIACAIITVFFKTDILLRAGARLVVLLKPFLYGAVIAYLINPVVTVFERFFLRIRRTVFHKDTPAGGALRMASILLTLAAVFYLIGLLLVTVLPELIRSITKLYRDVPETMEQFTDFLSRLDNGSGTAMHQLVRYIQDSAETITERLQEFLESDLLPTLRGMLPNITSSFLELFSFIYNFGIGCIVASYLLGGKERFFRQAHMVNYSLFPEKAAKWIEEEVHITDRMFSGFIHGKVLDSAIIGGICYLFCILTNMPYALLISLIVGLTNMIPFFGPYIGMIPSAILILMVSPTKCVIFLIFINILQQIDGNILGPMLLGDQLGLSGLWILFSIMFFNNLMGLPGMLIGVPTFAVLYDLAKRYIFSRLRRKGKPELVENYLETYHPPVQKKRVPKRFKPAGKQKQPSKS